MAPQPPHTLSVKRKRNEPPVHSLVVDAEHSVKRQKSRDLRDFVFRLEKPGEHVPAAEPSPAQPNRRFHVSLSAGQRVLVERPHTVSQTQNAPSIPAVAEPETATNAAPAAPASPPRKRPGAGTARHAPRLATPAKPYIAADPSEDQVRQFEQFSKVVEQEEILRTKPPSTPLKHKPNPPGRRFKDRHPAQAAALAVHDPDAMDVDDYVYDTYVREAVMLDADGKAPEHAGTVGFIVLKEEDEEWWNGDEDSDREFDTDEEDENAEDYYANDYPEDEMSSDDEFDRNLYKKGYRHGSDDEEYDLNDDDDVHSGDEDDEHFRRITASAQAAFSNRLAT